MRKIVLITRPNSAKLQQSSSLFVTRCVFNDSRAHDVTGYQLLTSGVGSRDGGWIPAESAVCVCFSWVAGQNGLLPAWRQEGKTERKKLCSQPSRSCEWMLRGPPPTFLSLSLCKHGACMQTCLLISFQRPCRASQTWTPVRSGPERRQTQAGLPEGHLAQVRSRSCRLLGGFHANLLLRFFCLQLLEENLERSLQKSTPPPVQVPHPPPSQVHLLQRLCDL